MKETNNSMNEPVRRMNGISRFFCWAGGGQLDVLEQMRTEHNRFFSYGTVICMTAVFATLSSAYAFNLLLSQQMGGFIWVPAIIWGSFIFFLDRFFVVTISNRGSGGRKLLMATPRLILAIFIGMIISKPIEFRIFETEIKEALLDMKISKKAEIDSSYRQQTEKLESDKDTAIHKFLSTQQEYQPLNNRIEELKKEIVAKDTAIFLQNDKVNCECNGACGTLRRGRGPACKAEERFLFELQREKAVLNKEMAEAKEKVSNLRGRFQQKIDTAITPYFTKQLEVLKQDKELSQVAQDSAYMASILNQQIALARIQNDKTKPTAWATVWFITILFIIIEMAPMLLKLMTRPGAYENRVAQIEMAYSTEDRLQRLLDLEEFKSNQRLVHKLAGSQRTIINSALDNWHRDQMDKMKDEEGYFTKFFTENPDNNNHQS